MNKKEMLLTIVGEEASEVHQRCTKAIRFGMKEVQEGQLLNNSQRILQEFNDFVAVMEMLYKVNIAELIDADLVADKKEKVVKYLKYSKQLGRLK